MPDILPLAGEWGAHCGRNSRTGGPPVHRSPPLSFRAGDVRRDLRSLSAWDGSWRWSGSPPCFTIQTPTPFLPAEPALSPFPRFFGKAVALSYHAVEEPPVGCHIFRPPLGIERQPLQCPFQSCGHRVGLVAGKYSQRPLDQVEVVVEVDADSDFLRPVQGCEPRRLGQLLGLTVRFPALGPGGAICGSTSLYSFGGLPGIESVVGAGEKTVLQATRKRRAHRVQVDVHHTREDRAFVDQGLAPEATLPKTASALVFAVGAAGDPLVETTHEPAEVRQPGPYLCNSPGIPNEILHPQIPGILSHPVVPGKDPAPALRHFACAPLRGAVRTIAEDEMRVIAHDRVGKHFHCKLAAEFADAFPHPCTAVLIALARGGIIPAKKGPPYTAGDAVVHTDCTGPDNSGSWRCHRRELLCPFLQRSIVFSFFAKRV